jgi:hypothetical protein
MSRGRPETQNGEARALRASSMSGSNFSGTLLAEPQNLRHANVVFGKLHSFHGLHSDSEISSAT